MNEIKFAYYLFVIYLAVQTSGQMLQRMGMKQVGMLNSTSALFSADTAIKIITSPTIIIGVSLSAVGFLLWLAVISNFRMSYIYPLSSIGYIIMAFMAIAFLGESISITQWIGTCVIVAGCILINI